MLKVVLDTNVLVSAAISSQGNPALIFEMLILGTIHNSTTPEIITEFEEVLQRPHIAKRLPPAKKDFILNMFKDISEIIIPDSKFQEVQEDPDDDKFLECAVSAGADFIISGDDHLLKIKEFRGIKILNPAEFVNLMNSKHF